MTLPPEEIALELREAAKAWLGRGRADLVAVRRCAEAPDVAGWIIGFHCQQAVEKAMKSLLVARGHEPPKTHDLVRIAEHLADNGIEVPAPDALLEALVPFAVSDRYPVLTSPERERDEVLPLIDEVTAALERVADVLQQP